MSYRLAKILLKKYINISFLCKTIELVTILTLQLYKNKILSSQKRIKFFLSNLKIKMNFIYVLILFYFLLFIFILSPVTI